MSNKPIYKLFCDESCHLEHDGSDVMVLGVLHCSDEKAEQLTRHIKWLRHQHNYHTELKWTKLISKQWPFYEAILNMFLDDPDLDFKSTVILDKQRLNHQQYNSGSHSNFYYKMFFYTLRDFLDEEKEYRIYLDYMDTLGGEKANKLCDILQNNTHWNLTASTTIVQSYESQLIQLCDLLIGAVAYKNRSDIDHSSMIKNKLIDHLQKNLGRNLDDSTPPWEKKFNIFKFVPRKS